MRAARSQNPSSWQQSKTSLDDQAIFGPVRDFACVCGKYEGHRYENMICDRCGVKVASAEVRRSRFAHVELSVPVPHPLGDHGEAIHVFPILPAAFFEAAQNAGLAERYEDLLRANGSGNAIEITRAIERICELLMPIVIQAHRWKLREAETLARGLGLVRKSDAVKHDGRCDHCGYVIYGLNADKCPGCGKTIERY